MKLIEKSILLGFILTLLISVTGFKAQCESIEKKVLRLHVIANSDSQEDQDLKLKVRDRILNYSESVFTDASNKNEAEIMPDINGRAWLESKVTWKAPNIIVPSMIA